MAAFRGQLEVVVTVWKPSMVIFDGQFKVIAALLKTKYGHLSAANLRLITSRGPSMTITESQLEAIAIPSETKHGNL